MNTINDFGDAVWTSLSGAMALLFAAVPRVLAFLAIVIIGWIIASLVARAVGALLRSVSFNSLAQRSGFSGFIHDMGVKDDALVDVEVLVVGTSGAVYDDLELE